MAQLKIRLRGQIVIDAKLEPDQTYTIGRSEDCSFVLQPEKGISREHLKISFVDGLWKVALTSRYGDLIQHGEKFQEISLDSECRFSVPPYEFEFSLQNNEAPQESIASKENSINNNDLTDRTVVGGVDMVPHVRFNDWQNEGPELIPLDSGEQWVAGREATCYIFIRDPRVSRRQFEIRKIGHQYQILDLESVNGTYLNGHRISSEKPTPIRSGDTIKVLDNAMTFELHDAEFKNQIQLVQEPNFGTLVPLDHDKVPMQYQQSSYNEMQTFEEDYHQLNSSQPPNAIGSNREEFPASPSSKFDFERHRPKIIMGVIAFLLIIFLLNGGKKEEAPKAAAATAQTPAQAAFLKLSPEQQALIRQRYKDATNFYMSGKYQLAQDEIVKILEIVPDYEDIKNLERNSKEAIFLQDQQRRQEEIEKAKAEAEEKIQKKVLECKEKINPDFTEAQLDECLSSVLQFNPEHPQFAVLRETVQKLTLERQANEAKNASYQADVAKLKAIFSKAEDLGKLNGRPLEVVAAFEKVVHSKLPDPGGLKKKSELNIASIRKTIAGKTSVFQSESDKLYAAGNLKGAILELRKAREIDPSNITLTSRIDSYTNELRKKMMEYYQEGILEESFGNVEGSESKAGAKEKWKKILETDIPEGEYYKKASIKLKKYGAI